MKSTGIIRKVDSVGRFVLPKELCNALDITSGTPMEVFTEGETILLRKYHPAGSCDFCGEVDRDTVQFHGKFVCAACRRKLGAL